MKSSNFRYLLFASSLLLMSACSFLDSDYGCCREVPIAATVTVTDLKGNALKNRDVSLSGYRIYSKRVQKTDEKGQTQFDFYWYGNNSGCAIWAIQAVENTDFKMVNLMLAPNCGGPNEGKVTLRDSIRMDSLKTMTIRVKTPRSDLNSLSLIVARDVGITPLNEAFNGSDYPSYVEYNYNNGQYGNPKVRQEIRQTFLEHRKPTNTPMLDTTFQVKVFANVAFKVTSGVNFTTEPKYLTRSVSVSATASRDSVLLIQF